jgi:hypothetical protein
MSIKETNSSKKLRVEMKKDQPQEQTTPGTIMAEKARARANGYTDLKRSDLLKKGMAAIYGNKDHAKTHVHRG